MSSNPILLSVLSASCYGAWAVLQNFSSQHIRPQQVQLCTAITSAIFALTRWLVSLSLSSESLSNSSVTTLNTSGSGGLVGVTFAIASGLGSFSGTYFFTEAIGAGGDVGTVSAISAAYPAIAYLFSLVLTTEGGVRIELHKVVGLRLAILSAIAFAYQPPSQEKIMMQNAVTNANSSSGIVTHIKTA